MPRVARASHDTFQARKELRERAEKAQLALPAAIADIRLSLGLSQAEFAKAFRLTIRQLSELENGRANPSLNLLNRIGRVLGLTVGFVPKSSDQSR